LFKFPSGWQRVAIAALLVIPFLVAIVFSGLGWLVWLFLPAERRKDFLQLVGKLIAWAQVIAGSVRLPSSGHSGR
jgi:hypothetical protein